MGHGLTALACGGVFDRLEIYGDASGLAFSGALPGWQSAAVAAGGLLAPPITATIWLGFSRKGPQVLLWLMQGVLFLSLLLWVRTSIGWVTIGSLWILMVSIAWYGSKQVCTWFVQYLAVVLGLYTIVDMDYLFVAKAVVAGHEGPSDAGQIANILGGPVVFWGSAIASLSILLLGVGAWLGLRTTDKALGSQRPRPARPDFPRAQAERYPLPK